MVDYSRFDYTFSYWILVWFLLYYYRKVPYNPKWLLVLGIISNILAIISFIKNKYSLKFILVFIIDNILIKVVPLILIMNTKINTIDIMYYLAVFFFYLLYMYFNQQNGIDYIFPTESIKKKEYSPPMVSRILKILNKNK
jgi:hypothetical protein